MRKRKQRPKAKPIVRFFRFVAVLFTLALIAGGVCLYIINTYTINTVYVEGNVHYSNEQIKNMVMKGKLSNNSLYLSFAYKNREMEAVPFIEKMSVTVLSADTVKITVYEKALAGYVEFLDQFVYFDKDGTVVECSDVKTPGVPEVVGLSFDYVILGEKLPCEDMSIFTSVLKLSQLLNKYGVEGDKMYFKSNGEMVLYCGNITVNLGNDDNIDIKIMNLPSILENLEGRTGTLRMENYNESTKKTSFETKSR